MSNIDFSKVIFQEAKREIVPITERKAKYADGEVTKVNKLDTETHKNVHVGDTIFSDYTYLLENKIVSQEQLNILGANKYFIMQQNFVRSNAIPLSPEDLIAKKVKAGVKANPENLAKLLAVMEKLGMA